MQWLLSSRTGPAVRWGVLVLLLAACEPPPGSQQAEAGSASVDPPAISPCELVWQKISNADLSGDRAEEGRLKQIAREMECYSRPATVPHQRYPEADRMPVPGGAR
ncbi:hypothetical protein BH23GEM7_BH23GEM7_27200 [soil metagenome]